MLAAAGLCEFYSTKPFPTDDPWQFFWPRTTFVWPYAKSDMTQHSSSDPSDLLPQVFWPIEPKALNFHDPSERPLFACIGSRYRYLNPIHLTNSWTWTFHNRLLSHLNNLLPETNLNPWPDSWPDTSLQWKLKSYISVPDIPQWSILDTECFLQKFDSEWLDSWL